MPDIARQTVEQRLTAHCDFVNQKLEDGTPPKHHNPIYDLPVFTKQETHRALDDILESIEELKYYVTFIQPGDVQQSEPRSAGDSP